MRASRCQLRPGRRERAGAGVLKSALAPPAPLARGPRFGRYVGNPPHASKLDSHARFSYSAGIPQQAGRVTLCQMLSFYRSRVTCEHAPMSSWLEPKLCTTWTLSRQCGRPLPATRNWRSRSNKVPVRRECRVFSDRRKRARSHGSRSPRWPRQPPSRPSAPARPPRPPDRDRGRADPATWPNSWPTHTARGQSGG
jgi:hypothetical protein